MTRSVALEEDLERIINREVQTDFPYHKEELGVENLEDAKLVEQYSFKSTTEDYARFNEKFAELEETIGEKIYEVYQCTMEGAMNFFQHANKEDPHKTVCVDILESQEAYWIIIRGEGEGFDPSVLPGPSENPEEALQLGDRGRGHMMMHAYSDYLAYSRTGRALYIGVRKDSRSPDA